MNKFILPILIILVTYSYGSAEGVLIGVAEDFKGPVSESNAGVRILFHKEHDQWVVLDTQASQQKLPLERVQWTIALNGKDLGNMVTVDDMKLDYPDCSWCFPRDKFFRIEDISRFPKLGNTFHGFGGTFLPNNRPVALVSNPDFKSIDKWKSVKPSHEIYLRIFPQIKKVISEPFHCDGPPDYGIKGFKPNTEDFELYQSFKNASGEMLVSVGVSKNHLENCTAPEDLNAVILWFYLGKEIKLIGSNLDLLYVGDLDSDGEAEFLFYYGGYNKDGYILFEKDFKERYEFMWRYH